MAVASLKYLLGVNDQGHVGVNSHVTTVLVNWRLSQVIR